MTILPIALRELSALGTATGPLFSHEDRTGGPAVSPYVSVPVAVAFVIFAIWRLRRRP